MFLVQVVLSRVMMGEISVRENERFSRNHKSILIIYPRKMCGYVLKTSEKNKIGPKKGLFVKSQHYVKPAEFMQFL